MTQDCFAIWIDTRDGEPINRLCSGGDCNIAIYTSREAADVECAYMNATGFVCRIVPVVLMLDERQLEAGA